MGWVGGWVKETYRCSRQSMVMRAMTQAMEMMPASTMEAPNTV